jgi:hypothetical protein
MADIHLWDGSLKSSLVAQGGLAEGVSRYPTLCGIHVSWVELVWWGTQSRQPTCMGCILVKFQEEAEQDGV